MIGKFEFVTGNQGAILLAGNISLFLDRHSSESSRKSTNMMINYATTFGTDLYLSPPSQNSGSSYSDQDNSKVLGMYGASRMPLSSKQL